MLLTNIGCTAANPQLSVTAPLQYQNVYAITFSSLIRKANNSVIYNNLFLFKGLFFDNVLSTSLARQTTEIWPSRWKKENQNSSFKDTFCVATWPFLQEWEKVNISYGNSAKQVNDT